MTAPVLNAPLSNLVLPPPLALSLHFVRAPNPRTDTWRSEIGCKRRLQTGFGDAIFVHRTRTASRPTAGRLAGRPPEQPSGGAREEDRLAPSTCWAPSGGCPRGLSTTTSPGPSAARPTPPTTSRTTPARGEPQCPSRLLCRAPAMRVGWRLRGGRSKPKRARAEGLLASDTGRLR